MKGWRQTEPKTDQARRTVVLPPVAVKALQVHRKRQAEERLKAGKAWTDQGLIFSTLTGEPMDRINLYRQNFQRILQAAELGAWEGEETDYGSSPVSPCITFATLQPHWLSGPV